MFNIEKVGEKIAVISNSTRYKRKNKIYLNKEKLTGEDAIKESDLIHIEAGEIMLSPDKDVEEPRYTYVVLRVAVNRISWHSIVSSTTPWLMAFEILKQGVVAVLQSGSELVLLKRLFTKRRVRSNTIFLANSSSSTYSLFILANNIFYIIIW